MCMSRFVQFCESHFLFATTSLTRSNPMPAPPILGFDPRSPLQQTDSRLVKIPCPSHMPSNSNSIIQPLNATDLPLSSDQNPLYHSNTHTSAQHPLSHSNTHVSISNNSTTTSLPLNPIIQPSPLDQPNISPPLFDCHHNELLDSPESIQVE